MTISVLKLVTGEEIIGQVQEMEFEGKNVLRVKHPAILMYKTNDDGTQYKVGMAPYAMSSRDNIIPIFSGQIVSIFDPAPKLLNRYNEKYAQFDVILNGEDEDDVTGQNVPEYLKESMLKEGDFLVEPGMEVREKVEEEECTNTDAT